MNNIEHFVDIGIALSTEKNHRALLELILKRAMLFANADAGTIYSVTTDKNDQKSLVFDTVFNNSLACHLGGTSTNIIDYPNIKLFNYGEINNSALVAIAGATRKVINVDDVYLCKDYDLTAAKVMDKRTGYHTQSVLTLPMQDHQQDLNGVIQLINATDNQNIIN